MWRNTKQARGSYFLLWSWPSINHHPPCVIPENRITPAGLLEGQDLGQENIHKSGTCREKELANKCHAELSPSASTLFLTLPSTPLPSGQSTLTSIWQRKRDLGIEPLNENTVTSSWIPLPPQHTDSRMEQAQAWEPESPKFETKLHHLLWLIYPNSLSLRFLHLQNKANKTYFEGWRPNKVIYVKHRHGCDISKHVFGAFLSLPSVWWPAQANVKPKLSLNTHPTHGSLRGMVPLYTATGDLIEVLCRRSVSSSPLGTHRAGERTTNLASLRWKSYESKEDRQAHLGSQQSGQTSEMRPHLNWALMDE